MFKHVLVGVDGRPSGRDAIALASRLAGPDAALTLLHVRTGQLHPFRPLTPALLADERETSQRLLEQERAATEVQAELLSAEAGSPGAGLHEQAEASGADLLVVGTCGRGRIGRVMLGDDTRAALNGAPCAVAVAAAGYNDAPLPLARIGVAYNGSPESVAALAEARELAAPTRAEIELMEVVALPTYAFTGLVPPAFGETIELMLSEANARLGEIEGVRGRAVYGLAGEELAAFGDAVDLLVVGSRSYGPVKRLVLGSTSDYLERHARSSLLVLPRPPVPAATATAAAAAG